MAVIKARTVVAIKNKIALVKSCFKIFQEFLIQIGEMQIPWQDNSSRMVTSSNPLPARIFLVRSACANFAVKVSVRLDVSDLLDVSCE